jgi:hypothetical protein
MGHMLKSKSDHSNSLSSFATWQVCNTRWQRERS